MVVRVLTDDDIKFKYLIELGRNSNNNIFTGQSKAMTLYLLIHQLHDLYDDLI